MRWPAIAERRMLLGLLTICWVMPVRCGVARKPWQERRWCRI